MAGISILSQGLVVAILLVYHGASTDTDTLFLALSFLLVFQLLALMSFDQFVVFFLRKIALDKNSANIFYYQVVFVSVLWVCILVLLVKTLFVFIPLAGGHVALVFKDIAIFEWFILSLPAYVFVALNDRYYNAMGKITLSYFLVLVPNISILVGVIVWTFYSLNYGVEIVAINYTILMWISAIISTYIVSKERAFKFKFNLNEAKEFFLNSLLMRVGHNIYALSFQMVSNYFLIGMSEGFLSLFNYAYRGVVAIFAVAVGPSYRLYMYNLSSAASKGELLDWKKYVRPYLKESLVLYLGLFLILSIFIHMFDIYNLKYLLLDIDIQLFYKLIFIIFLWQMIVMFESIYVGLIVASTYAKLFITINTIFAIFYFTISYLASIKSDILMFAIAGLVSQIFSFFLYKRFSQKLLENSFGAV